MGQGSDYNILEGFNQIETILKRYGKSIDDCDQLEYNGAYVLFLKDGNVLLFSNNGTVGILFENESTYRNMLDTKYFPVPDPPSMFYQIRSLIDLQNFSVTPFLDRLERLGLTNILESSHVEESFQELSDKINQLGKENINTEEFISIGFFLQEILRIEYKGKWKLDQENSTLNPYYIPTVSFKGFTIPIWTRFDGHWRLKKNISLSQLYLDLKREISFFQ